MAEETPKVAPAADYDQFVDWDKRLARETPLFRKVFGEVGATSVIDVGAGSARHSIVYATWGMRVWAVDPDESMLAQARVNASVAAPQIEAAGGSLEIVRAGFGQLAALPAAPADALTCTGNALPHVDGHAGLRVALADFSAALRPGGALVLHLLNHAKLLSARPRSIPPVVRDTPDGTRVFLRVLDYPEGDEFIQFDFLTLTRGEGGVWDMAVRRSPHTALPVEFLRAELSSAGFEGIVAYGDHSGRAFDVEQDESVVIVARKA